MSIPSVVQAYAVHDYTIVVQFDDGKIVRFSVRPLVDRGGVFEALKDQEFFRKNLTVLHGTVAWSPAFDDKNCIDLDPLVIYETGEDITGETAN